VRGFSQSYRTARKCFQQHPPDAVLGMGGFTSAPPILAAKAAGAATFLHESNAIPGRANRWLSRVVNRAFVGFPSACRRLKNRSVTVTGTPVRPPFHPRDVRACRTDLGLDPARPVLLVTGGSQGASGLNDMLLLSLPLLAKLAPEWQWFHLTGPNDTEKVKQVYANLKLNAVVHPFFDRMEVALGAASAAISRAGASSLAEVAAMRLPAVLVPYPAATDNHQFENARAFEQTGAARLLEEHHATPDALAHLLLAFIESSAVRQKMQAALAQWHAPAAAWHIAQAILHPVTQEQRDAAPLGQESTAMRDA